MQIDTRHPAEKYLSAFEAPFLAVDPGFWRIVDGSRKHLHSGQGDTAYTSMQGVATELSPHARIIQAMLCHPSINHSVDADDIAQRTPAWQTAVHDLGRKIAAMGAYRASRQIVQMDPALEKELLEHDIPVGAPASLLKGLPAWGMYLEYGAATKEKLGNYAADGAFLSLYREDDDLVLDVTPINTSDSLPRLLISLRDDNELGRFIANLKTDPAWPLLKLVCNTALHLAAGAPNYQSQNTLSNPVETTHAGARYFDTPIEQTQCRIAATEEIHAAARAIEFVDRARNTQSTPQP